MDADWWRQQRNQAARRHIEKYLILAEDDGVTVENFLLRAEHRNVETAAQHAIRLQQTDELQRLIWAIGQPYDGYLSRYGHWHQLSQLLHNGVDLSLDRNETVPAAAFQADLATIQMWEGNLELAQENYRAALARLKIANPVPAIQIATAVIYHHLGNIAQQTFDYSRARSLHKKALGLHSKLENHGGIAKALHQLGSLAAAEAKREEARDFYRQGLKMSRMVEDRSQFALTLWNLGNLAYEEGRLISAERLLHQARRLFLTLNDERNIAGVLHMLGQVALDKREVNIAQDYAEQSLKIKETLGYRLSQHLTLSLLGVVSYARGDNKAAERYFKRALADVKTLEIWPEVNKLRFNLATLYRLQGHLNQATPLLQEMVATNEQYSLPSLEQDQVVLAQHLMEVELQERRIAQKVANKDNQ